MVLVANYAVSIAKMINIASKTDVGKIRKQNEDSIRLVRNQLGHVLLLVADGMGGHNAGEVASSIACREIGDSFENINTETDYKVFIKEALLNANTVIYRESLMYSEYAKMGTTASMLIFDGRRVFIGHIGDSRIYYISDSKIMQITKDHTLVEAMMDAGNLTADEARKSRYKNVLLQALGTSKKLTIDIKEIKIPRQFKFLLCSDGLTGEVTDEEIKEHANKLQDLQSRVDGLVDLANEKDGSDNVSIIMFENRS